MDKMNKNDIIESIKYHYFKKGRLCMNLNKQPKEKLIQHMIDNNIDVINKTSLEEEIKNIETFNFRRDIIYCNFIKYENISYDVVSKITDNTSNEELLEIIEKNNLTYEDDFKNFKDLVFDIYKSYKTYCEKSFLKNECSYITFPNIIKALKKIA
jgi:transcriptional/translational regulatory protein YebC/TACO1